MAWLFRLDNTDVVLPIESPIRFSGDVLGCVGYAMEGGGLVQTYDFIAKSPVFKAGLVEVLMPYRGRSRPFSVLYPHNRHLSARVRAFVDFLVAEVDAQRLAIPPSSHLQIMGDQVVQPVAHARSARCHRRS